MTRKIGRANNNAQDKTIAKLPIPPVTNATPLSAERKYLPSKQTFPKIPLFVIAICFVIMLCPLRSNDYPLENCN